MKVIILLSGGIDSVVLLVQALEQGHVCTALTFNYGQRNFREELRAARQVAKYYDIDHKIIEIDRHTFSDSSLVSKDIEVPKDRSDDEVFSKEKPNTYVPGRNTLFLSYAMIQAEILNADEIHIGAMSEDKAYPDCRKGFIDAFQRVFNEALQNQKCTIIAPFLKMNKAEVISLGMKLSVPYDITFSCYDPSSPNTACGKCDACKRRKKGFDEANL